MHPTVSCVSLVWASTAIAADSSVPPIAYQAEAVADATTQTQQVWSDGVHTRGESTASNDDKSGYYTDSEKKLTWVYGPTFPCVQVPSHASTSPKIEELVGGETLDGHPTQKFMVSSNTVSGKAVSKTAIEWRATDLGNLVIQWKTPDGTQHNLRHIVVGAPDAKAMLFPSPPCKYDESKDTSHFAAEAPGGFRMVIFSDLACKKLVPPELKFSLPSDF